MDISYKGGNSLIIATKKTSLIVDPNVTALGLKSPNVEDMIEVATEPAYVLPGARLLVETPGEYEVGDFSIKGVPAQAHIDPPESIPRLTIYRIETTEIRIALLGHIAPKLSEEQLEELGLVDVLIIPVGGNGFTLDPHDASVLTRQIDPKAVIPVHYEDAGVKYEVPQLALEAFVSELNVPVIESDKYKLKNAGALPEVLSIIALKRA